MSEFAMASFLYIFACTMMVMFATPSTIGKIVLTVIYSLTYTVIYATYKQSV